MEKTIFTLKKIIISCVNYRTLHVKQPDVASGVRPEMKPLHEYSLFIWKFTRVKVLIPGGDPAYERGGGARRKFWIKPLKETDLGVAQAF